MRANQNHKKIKILALAHASAKTISRGSGRSATAAAAYRSAERVVDKRTGEIHDYRRRSGVDHVSMHAPVGSPTMTTAELWNKVEAAEKRVNSTVARELVVALPAEIDQFQRRELADSIAAALVERYTVAAQVAVHTPGAEGDQRNHHAHIMFTTRQMDANGEFGAKTRQLDDLKTGPDEIRWMRGMVEAKTNEALERAGYSERIDMRSLKDQHAEAVAIGDPAQAAATDRPATVHLGPRVTAIARECALAKREPLGLCDRIEDARQARRQRELARVNAQIIYANQEKLGDILSKPAIQVAQRQTLGAKGALVRDTAAHAGCKAQRDAHVLAGKHCESEAQQWRSSNPFRSWFGLDEPAQQLDSKAADHAAAAKAIEADMAKLAHAVEHWRSEVLLREQHGNKLIEEAQRPSEPEPEAEPEPDEAQWIEQQHDGRTWGHWSDKPDDFFWYNGSDWIKYEPPSPRKGPGVS